MLKPFEKEMVLDALEIIRRQLTFEEVLALSKKIGENQKEKEIIG